MIRYSSYGATNFRLSSAQIIYQNPLAEQHRELLELRERVRRAEATAAQRKNLVHESCADPLLQSAG
jgi:hypothetical protein